MTWPMITSDNKSLLTASCRLTYSALDQLLTVYILNATFINICFHV